MTSYLYDGNNNLTRATDALNQQTNYVYDAANNRTSMANAEVPPKTTSYTYDQLNRLKTVTDPLSQVTTYNYDANGNRTSKLDAENDNTTYTYDANNRLLVTTLPVTPTPYVITNVYDAVGNRTSMTDDTGLTTYAYDAVYRLTSVTNPSDNAVSYGYDNVGNRTTLTYHDGKVVTYTYDAANRMKTVVDWGNRTTTYNYDDAGRLTSTVYPTENGTTATYGYDNADRLTSVENKKGAATITSHVYTLDNDGNRTQAFENIGASTYGYDNLYRLTSVTYPGPTTVSNRLTKVEGGTTNYTYNAADELLSDVQFSNYAWDNNGNMDSRGTQSYGYDPANQLNDATIGGSTTSYIYNGDGVRTARETSSTYTEYVIDHNRSLPVILYDESAFYVWGLDLIARTQQYYHYDGLGSTRALTGNTGTTLATYNYDVFGAIRSQTGSQTNNFLFTGEWRDPETGFYFLRARYYDPVVGRFITRDPFGGFLQKSQSANRYAYSVNDPVNLVDPSGRCGFRSGGDFADCFTGKRITGGLMIITGTGLVAVSIVIVGVVLPTEVATAPASAGASLLLVPHTLGAAAWPFAGGLLLISCGVELIVDGDCNFTFRNTESEPVPNWRLQPPPEPPAVPRRK